MLSNPQSSLQGQQRTAPPSHAAKHLIVLQHGLIGMPEDLACMALNVTHSGCILLNSKTSSMLLTLDGVDVCGDRLAQEVCHYAAELTSQGIVINQISFIGYSLGGGSLLSMHLESKPASNHLGKHASPSVLPSFLRTQLCLQACS